MQGSLKREVSGSGGFLAKCLAAATGCVVLALMLPFPVYSAGGLITVAVTVASLCLMHTAVGLFHFRRMTIPGFSYLVYFLVIFLPAFAVYQNGAEGYRFQYLFSVESALITIPLGILFGSWLTGFRRAEITAYFDSPIVPEPVDRAAIQAFLGFLAFACAVAVLHASQVETIPLLYVLRHPGEWLEAAVLREDSMKLLNSRYTYLFYVVRGTLFPFLTLLSFGLYLQCRKLKWLLIFLGTLTAAVAYAAMTIEKSPVATLSLMLFLFYYLLKQGKISTKVMVIGLLAFLAFPLLVILSAYSGKEAGTLLGALGQIWNRIFHSPTEVLYYYFEVFPDLVPFQHGASIGKLASLLDWNTINIPNIVALHILGSQGNLLPSTTANACFLGNLNADFGLPGVVFGGMLAGLAMQFVQIVVFRLPKCPSNLCIYAILMFVFAKLSSVPLPVVLLSDGTIFVFILSGFIKRCAKSIRVSSPRLTSPAAG